MMLGIFKTCDYIESLGKNAISRTPFSSDHTESVCSRNYNILIRSLPRRYCCHCNNFLTV